MYEDKSTLPPANNETGVQTAIEGIEVVNTEKRRIAGVFETCHSDFIKINSDPHKSKSEADFISMQGLVRDFGDAARHLKSIKEKTADNITWQDFKNKVDSIATKLSKGNFEMNSDLDKLRMSMGEIATSLNQLPKGSLNSK